MIVAGNVRSSGTSADGQASSRLTPTRSAEAWKRRPRLSALHRVGQLGSTAARQRARQVPERGPGQEATAPAPARGTTWLSGTPPTSPRSTRRRSSSTSTRGGAPKPRPYVGEVAQSQPTMLIEFPETPRRRAPHRWLRRLLGNDDRRSAAHERGLPPSAGAPVARQLSGRTPDGRWCRRGPRGALRTSPAPARRAPRPAGPPGPTGRRRARCRRPR